MQFIDEIILLVGLSPEPITDFGVLQRSCPEARIFINNLEKRILPTDQKLKRKLEHVAQDFFMKEGKLCHRQQSTGRQKPLQEVMAQLVVPISECKKVVNEFRRLALLGFDKCCLAVSKFIKM